MIVAELKKTVEQKMQKSLEARQVTDDAKTDATIMELGNFVFQRTQEQLHQERHFFLRPAPVLGAERKQGEVRNSTLDTGLNHGPDRLDAAFVPCHPRQEAATRPAPVAVHDEGDMARHSARLGNGTGRTNELRHLGGFPDETQGGAATAQTAIRSASFAARILSTSAT